MTSRFVSGSLRAAIASCGSPAVRPLLALALACALTATAAVAQTPSALVKEAESLTKQGLLHDANNAYRAALKLAPNSADIRVRWGRLYLQTHQNNDAGDLFEEALKLDPKNTGALVGMAEAVASTCTTCADDYASKALAIDPKYIPAIAIKIKHALQDEKTADAEKMIAAGLAIDPNSIAILGMSAADAYVRADNAEVSQRTAETLKRNPTDGEVYMTLAHFAELHRQFAEARDYYRLAVKTDPRLWKAYAELGVTLSRLGDDEGAREALEIAFKGDPFNPWTSNTLKLIDTFKTFDTFETPSFRVKLAKKESAIMRPYVEELLERAITTFEKEYGFTPPDKTSFEMFPNHDDFAVRTVGVAGLGALGASFGKTVAMDSPAGRDVGEFHWGSTLWHETAHVITLQATNNRIPRWLTEGLSVYEEWRAGWGDRMDLETIKNLQQDKLMPVAELNKGFVRPTYNGQVQFAYYEGGMLCRYIVEKYGFEKVRELLAAYKSGEENVAAVEHVLGLKTPELDKGFREWMDQKTGSMVKAIDLKWREQKTQAELQDEVARNPNNYYAQLHLAQAFVKSNEQDKALFHALAARKAFPEYTGHNSPYEIAANAYLATGKIAEARVELQRWVAAGGMDPALAKKLASLYSEVHQDAEAIKVLEGFLYIAPQDPEIHQKLAELYMTSVKPALAVREYTVGLAFHPVDMAMAHYNLARALAADKRPGQAKRELLESLEIAPNFAPAQKLLLELTDNEGKS